MPTLHIILEGDNCWPDLRGKENKIIHLSNDTVIDVAALSGGMQTGLPSVAFRIDLPDGHVVVAETSLRLFITAAKMFIAKYGDPTRY